MTKNKDFTHVKEEQAVNNLSEIADQLGNKQLAVKLAQAAVELTPNRRAPYDTLAFAKAVDGDVSDAARNMSSYIQASTRNPNMTIDKFLSGHSENSISGQAAYHMSFISHELADKATNSSDRAHYESWSKQFDQIAHNAQYKPEQWELNLDGHYRI